MAGLVPAIHVLQTWRPEKTWMPGTRPVLGPAEGRTRVPGVTLQRSRHEVTSSAARTFFCLTCIQIDPDPVDLIEIQRKRDHPAVAKDCNFPQGEPKCAPEWGKSSVSVESGATS